MATANRYVLHGAHGTKIQFDPHGSGVFMGELGRQVRTYQTNGSDPRLFRTTEVTVQDGIMGKEAKALLDVIPDFGSHWLYVFVPAVDADIDKPAHVGGFAAIVLDPIDLMGRSHPATFDFVHLVGTAQVTEEAMVAQA